MALDETKKALVKQIIRELHQGLGVEQAKERLVREVGTITSPEIAEIEQSLINEGVSPDEIKKFCNVHALMFEAGLENTVADPASPAHPVMLFKSENREIQKILDALKKAAEELSRRAFPELKKDIKEKLEHLSGIKIHYERKENVLFPYLERQGFYGPSKVMWGKDNEVRGLLKVAQAQIGRLESPAEFAVFMNDNLMPLIEEAEGMIFKEENVLFPTALEKLSAQEWAQMLKQSNEIGYAYIRVPEEVALLSKAEAGKKEALGDGVSLPTGALSIEELAGVLNTLPVDITFIDKDDTVKYFSDNKDRIFPRTTAVIGRKVQNCHPPKSVHMVNAILEAFRSGTRSEASFWINMHGKFVYIRYFAVRGKANEYIGTLEVSQEISGIRALEGERRIFDDKA